MSIIMPFEEIRPGHKLDKYTLLEQIGHGGQAVVWSGMDEIKRSVVAVKLVDYAEEDTILEPNAFDQQVQLVANLVHPHIVPLYHFGTSGRYRYMVTRYICGGSLEDTLSDGPLPIPETLRLASQIVSALEYIHGLNMVHRDIKPSNVLLDTQRNAYLTDFGLARILSQSTRALHTGRGTPAYSPPEQVLSAPLTLRSDIYTLGIMLYEMFTGQLPWDGMASLASRQLREAERLPELSEINPIFPPELTHVLRAMTAPDPENRPATASEALKMIYGILRVPSMPHLTLTDADERLDIADALSLLKTGIAAQDMSRERLALSLTDFFCIDTIYTHAEEVRASFDVTARQFMLRAALVHGHRVDQWQQVALAERLQACTQTIAFEEEVAVERAVALLLRESDAALRNFDLPSASIERLLNMAVGGANVTFKVDAIDFLGKIGDQTGKWREIAFSPVADQKLAAIAQADDFEAKEAARLIGRIRSTTATLELVHAWIDKRNPHARAALIAIQKTAGSFPSSVPLMVQWQLSGQVGIRQLATGGDQFILPLITTILGSVLGVAFQIYETTRLTGIFAIERISMTLEQGLFLGIPLGVGIFVTRLISKRFDVVKPVPKIVIGTVIGGGIVNLSIVVYQFLFLKAAPTGWLITLGSALVVLGFAISAVLSRSAWLVRVLLNFVFVEMGIFLPWLLSRNTALTPIFHYEYDWSMQQVALVSCIVSLCIALVAQLADVTKEI